MARYAYARATRPMTRYTPKSRTMTKPRTVPMPMTRPRTRYPIVPFGFRGVRPNMPMLRGFRRGGKPNPLNPQKIRPVGTGSSMSKFNIKFKASKKAYLQGQIAAVDRYYSNTSMLRLIPPGRQDWHFESVGNTIDLLRCFNVANTGSGIVDTDTTGPIANQKYYTSILLRSMSLTSTFTNQTSSTMFLKLYELVPRNNLITNSTSAGVSPVQVPLYDPVQCISAMTSTGSGEYTYVGAEPTYSQLFTSNYRILKTYTIELAQGRSHQHIANYTLNNVMRGADLDIYNVPTSVEFLLKNYSRILLYKTYGQAVDSADDLVVTTSPGQMDVIHNFKVSFSGITDSSQQNYFVNNLANTGTFQVMNIGTGTPLTVTDA